MSNYNLKPCPFCGSTDIKTIVEKLGFRTVGHWKVSCQRCWATVGEPSLFGKPDTEYQAVKMWNRRAKPCI